MDSRTKAKLFKGKSKALNWVKVKTVHKIYQNMFMKEFLLSLILGTLND